MTGVVIGCGRGDLHATGDRARGADEGRRFLDVPAFRDECGAEAHLLAATRLVHQRRGPFAAGAGQQVVAELIECCCHCQTPCLYPQFQTSVIRPSTTRKISILPTLVFVPSLSSIGDWYTIATCSPSSPATTRLRSNRSLSNMAQLSTIRWTACSWVSVCASPTSCRTTVSPINSSARSKFRSFHTTRLYSSTTSRAVRVI